MCNKPLGTRKKMWLVVSIHPQHEQFVNPFQIFKLRFALDKILFFKTNQAKTLILCEILAFHMKSYGTFARSLLYLTYSDFT